MAGGVSREELPRRITCEACNWEVVVEGGRYIQGVSPVWAARARRSGHISSAGCPIDAVEITAVESER